MDYDTWKSVESSLYYVTIGLKIPYKTLEGS